MKITTFNEHGNVLEEHDYGNLAPKCFLEFNPSQPIFSVEEDELNIILTKSVSPKKTNLVDQFKAAFDIDYNLFRESKYNKFRNIEETFSGLSQDKEIELVDKELSVLLKDYSIKYKSSKLSPCASEILLSEKWIDVLLYHAFNSGIRNRRAKDPDSAFLISFLNLLSRYYYALKRQFEIGNLGVRAEEQLITLRAYINLYKSLYGRPVGFNNGFYERLLLSLHVSNYKNKCVHYNLIVLIEQLAGATTNGMCHFEITDSRNAHKNNKYVFCLSKFKHKEQCTITLNDLEIASLSNPTPGNIAFENVKEKLSEIYNEYSKEYKERWEHEVLLGYEEYRLDDKTVDWGTYKRIWKKRVFPSVPGEIYPDPPKCYYDILFFNDKSGQMLDICDPKIIAGLFDKLIMNNDKDQKPLYWCMICWNYLKKQTDDSALDKAKRYIEPIYNGDFVIGAYKSKIRLILDAFFSMPDIEKEITKIEPQGFDGGFNLKLVYNYLGLLIKKEVLYKKGKEIDKIINEKAVGKGLTKCPNVERKHYINDWNIKKQPIEPYKEDVKKLVEDNKKS